MQTSSLASVDMMSAGPPASTAAVKTGQDDIFAAHLAAASQEQTAAPAQQAKTAASQESTSAADQQIPDSGDAATTAQPEERANNKETGSNASAKTDAPGYNLAQQLQALRNANETGNDTTGKTGAPGYNLSLQLHALLNAKETGSNASGETTPAPDQTNKDDLSADAALNGSAGAANAATIPLLWTGADMGFTANGQAAAKTQNNESILARMLDAITSAANGSTATLPTKSPDAPVPAETTAAATTEATTTAPAAPVVPAFTMATAQPLLPTDQPLAAPVLSEATMVPSAIADGASSIAGNNTASRQPQPGVSFASETTPAAEAASPTEKTTIASPSVTAQSQPDALPTAARQNPAQQAAAQVVQNQYGQILTIHQPGETQELAAATTTDSKPAATVTTGKNTDAATALTPSRLANEAAPKNLENESGSPQQDTAQDNRQKGTNTGKTITAPPFQPEQLTVQAAPLTGGSENQSLIFPNQQASAPLLSTPLADASSMRLPSGLTVPGETVVDQMITHFSVNNRLESGTVNLRLHPQELGEVRMELKITQDSIKAHFIAQTPQAQEMITQHLPRLREALEQQGLHLQQVEVSIAANDNAGRDQFQGHNGQQQLHHSMHNSRGNQPIFALDSGEDTREAAQILNNLSVMA